jgi:hypothetical protein
MRHFFLSPAVVFSVVFAGLEQAQNLAGKVLHLIQDRLSDAEFGKNAANPSRQFAATATHRFEFHKRSQLFVGMHNKAPSVVAMRICNKDYLPVGSDRRDATPTEFGLAKSIGNLLPVLHAQRGAGLLILVSRLRRRFAQFNLGADFLDLPLQFSNGNLEILMLLCNHRF